MRVFSSSYLYIHHEPKLHSLELEWRGRTQGDELRVGVCKGLEFAQQHQIRAWIANMTHMHVICPEDQAWLKVEWLPRLRPLGIEFLAVVISTDALNRLCVHNIMCESEQDGHAPLETVYFSSAQDARDWVRQACEGSSLPWIERRR
ncbi:hypothetical protein [Hymenobacter sp. YC55]|uniref:hypothetical protein n=1 Tax=Hymenobacter sp. YC55 TaxID=3034019 RepID=UPI0023F9266C|nr:hypothetical protein [Hymenobacter sp. YC55]MDF7813229.1 hypothetical protein [Hymenobacter sp. YC55]